MGKTNSFINDSDRIARRDYQPTDDDVIRARLRTLGVQEYKFIFDHGMYPDSFFLFPYLTCHTRSNNGPGMEIVRCRRSKEHSMLNFFKALRIIIIIIIHIFVLARSMVSLL